MINSCVSKLTLYFSIQFFLRASNFTFWTIKKSYRNDLYRAKKFTKLGGNAELFYNFERLSPTSATC